MERLNDRVAIVTGGGSGIGRGICTALASEGCHLVVADIEVDAARDTVDEISDVAPSASAAAVDVTNFEAISELANFVYSKFGAVDLLCNNAGVGGVWPLVETTKPDWDWLLSVNLGGIVNGLRAFLPRMLEQEGEKHIVNTASSAGIGGLPLLGAYAASKHAVVGLSDVLRLEGAPAGLGVSVLCPGPVRSRIREAQRNRREAFGPAHVPVEPPWANTLDELEPRDVGVMVCDAIKRNRFFVVTHAAQRQLVEERYRLLLEAFEALEDQP